ncbi:MAG TPA: hypothetical protein VKB93_03735 [Thermoanaerobaculia bacterium]|nr:hypothetical protein [Thermoanaerobaculia bacterium]
MILLLCSFVVATNCVAAPAPCASANIFDVYDRLLPVRAAHHGPDVETVTLRYIPGDTSQRVEIKVIIREHADGKIAVEAWRPAATSIQQQLRDLRAAHPTTECDDAFVDQIKVEHYDLADPRIARLYRDFKKLRVPVAVDSDIYLDTARFEVLTEAPMNSTSFILYGPGLSDRHPHALITWAAAVVEAASRARPRR